MRLRSLLFFGCAVLTTCLLVLSAVASAQEVDVKPLAVAVKRAYPELRVRRPITLTHAGHGRKFVVSEQGVIHILPKDESGDEAAVFLDIEAKVDYEDKENEEGLLGLAFHPKFKENGEFFVYYTLKNPPHTPSALSRFKVSKADPNKADPVSEEEILRIPQPYWNHNGGGLMFGPEGYLYVTAHWGTAVRATIRTAMDKICPRCSARSYGSMSITKIRGWRMPFPKTTRSWGKKTLGPRSTPTACGTFGA